MDGEHGAWVSLVEWILHNPEKTALFLVFVAGVWSYVREFLRSKKDEDTVSDFTQMLLRENKELREELRLTRKSRTAPRQNPRSDCSTDGE